VVADPVVSVVEVDEVVVVRLVVVTDVTLVEVVLVVAVEAPRQDAAATLVAMRADRGAQLGP
jgi:hypothetical protein